MLVYYKKHPRNQFQRKLRDDARDIAASSDLFVPADKTTNIYKMPKDTYNKLLDENISAKYKKSNANIKKQIDQEAKSIASRLSIAD